MRAALELYKKEGMAAVRAAYPKCQHTMTISRYKKAVEGMAGTKAQLRWLKKKIKARLVEKKKDGEKVTKELAEKVYEEMKGSSINSARVKVCWNRWLTKVVKEVIDEVPDDGMVEETVEWIHVDDYLQDKVQESTLAAESPNANTPNVNVPNANTPNADSPNVGVNITASQSEKAKVANIEITQVGISSAEEIGLGHLRVGESMTTVEIEQVITIDGNNSLDTETNRFDTETNRLDTGTNRFDTGMSVSDGMVPELELIGETAVPVRPLKWSKVLLIGDSVIQFGQGWVSLLAQRVTRVADIINRGFSGYNTRWYRCIIQQIMSEWPPSTISCVILSFGMIDSALSDCPTRQHVPFNEFKENLSGIIQTINCHGVPSDRIIIIGPPFFDSKRFKSHRESMVHARRIMRRGKETVLYHKGAKKVAKTNDIDFVDLYNVFKEKTLQIERMRERKTKEKGTKDGASNDGMSMDFTVAKDEDEGWPYPLSDGLHLSEDGSEILFKQLEPIVVKKIQRFNHWTSSDWHQAGQPWQIIAQHFPRPKKNISKISVTSNQELNERRQN